jgi:hypothetical protein
MWRILFVFSALSIAAALIACLKEVWGRIYS